MDKKEYAKFERCVHVAYQLPDIWRCIESLKTDLIELDAHLEAQEKLNNLQKEIMAVSSLLVEDIPMDTLDEILETLE